MESLWLDEVGQIVKGIEERVMLSYLRSQHRLTPEQGIQALTPIKDLLWLHRINYNRERKLPNKELDDLYEMVVRILNKFKEKLKFKDEDPVQKDILIKLENSSYMLNEFLHNLNNNLEKTEYLFMAFSAKQSSSSRVSLGDVALKQHPLLQYLKNILDYTESEFLYHKITTNITTYLLDTMKNQFPTLTDQFSIQLGMGKNEKGFLFPDFFYVLVDETPVIKFDLRFKRYGKEDEYPTELQSVYDFVATTLQRFGYNEQEDLFY